MSALAQDFRIAVRLLLKDRLFTIVAAVALGLGIGVNNTFFTLVNAAVLRGLPIHDSERVMFLGTRDARDVGGGFSYPEFDELRRSSRIFAAFAAYRSAPTTIVDLGDADVPADRVIATYISSSGFDVVGVAPILGRGLVAADDQPGAAHVVVLAAPVWQTRYAADRSVVGRRVILNGEPATVVGVMPADFRFPGNTDIWQQLSAMPGLLPESREARTLSVFGRLRPEATAPQGAAELNVYVDTWSSAFPTLYTGIRTTIVPINEQFAGRVTDTVWLAFITAGVLVLLIACANVANLLLMRASGRGREVAIRMALGATRARVLRYLLVESALLAGLGAAVGMLLSAVALAALHAMVPIEVARLFEFSADPRVLAALVVATSASVVVFGLTPALHVSRVSVVVALNDIDRSGLRSASGRWATVFLVGEFALTLVVMANVAMSVRLGRAARQAEFEIDPTPLLTMSVTLPNRPYATPDARNRFFDRLHEQIAALPGVAAVTIAGAIPGGGGQLRPIRDAGRADDPRSRSPQSVVVTAGDDYFKTIAVALVRGRSFSAADRGSELPAVVNERFATLFFPGEDPLGRVIAVTSPVVVAGEVWSVRIIGVAPSIRQRQGGAIQPDPVVYIPAWAEPPTTAVLIVRAEGSPAALTPSIREAARQVDPSLPMYRAMTLTQALDQLRWNGRISKVLLDGIGTIALILALVGLYAVTTSTCSQRRKELAVRTVLGAQPRQIGAAVFRRVIHQVAGGILLGVAGTFAFDRFFTASDPSIRLTDGIVIVPTIVAIVLVGFLAAIIPVYRAAHSNAMTALRS